MAQYWLSWSGYSTYKKCPKKYKLTRVDKVEPPEPESMHNAVVGWTVQRVYEDFYNEEIWRAGKDTSKKLLDRVPKYFYQYLDENHVDFDHPHCRYSQVEMLDTCKDLVPRVLSGIKREQLIGPFAKSEKALRAHLTGNYFLYAKVDFLIRRVDNEIILLDGKASRHREKYVDVDQLMFYALAFKLVHNNTLPDRLGFYYFRFAEDEELAFDWFKPDPARIAEMENDLLEAFTNIQKKRFGATPGNPHCGWCPWENVCAERQKELAIKREKRRWNRAQRGEEVLPPPQDSDLFVGFGGTVEKVEDDDVG